MPFSRFLLLRGATRIASAFHSHAHVDAVAHLNDTECGLEKLNQYYLVNFAQNK